MTRVMKISLSILRFTFASILLAGIAGMASAQTIIYRETFGNVTAGNAAYSTVGWTSDIFNSIQGLSTGQSSLSGSHGISNLAGRLANLDNINAGTSTSLTNGFAFIGSNTSGVNLRTLSYTTEYPFTLAAPNINGISFFAGHTGTTLANVTSRPALLVGGTWYVTTTSATTASINGAAFAASAEFKQFALTGSTQLHALNALNLAPITATPVNLSSLGNVAAFGVFAETPANLDFVRFDTYVLTVPEPSAVGLMGLGVAAVLALRRRRKNA